MVEGLVDRLPGVSVRPSSAVPASAETPVSAQDEGRGTDSPLNQALLLIGEAGKVRIARRTLAACPRLAAMEVLIRAPQEDYLALLAERQSIGVVLLLWNDSDLERLLAQVKAILRTRGNPFKAVMLRSTLPLPEEVRGALWRLGVADLLFAQDVASADLADSIATVSRDYARNQTLAAVSASTGGFAKARTLRELAAMALEAVHERGIGQGGGLFCFRGDSAKARTVVVAGTGIYSGFNSLPLTQVGDALAEESINRALQRRECQFSREMIALYIGTPDGHTASIFLPLAAPLVPWEQGFIRILARSVAVAIDQTQLAHRLLRTQHATITTLATFAEYRDVDTGEHVARVARGATEIAAALAGRSDMPEIDADFIEQIGLASILHDVGKIAIPDSILMKPGALDAAERRAMEEHVTLGWDILLRAARRSDNGELLKAAAEIAVHHHERYDGTGYPAGLKGDAIPLAARIVALVDVFDALTSLRPYKQAWPVEKALDFIRERSGSHFDPRVVEAFLALEVQRKDAMFIEWTEAMSVGHPDLDFDHRRLIGIINRLWVANGHGHRRVIEFILDDLVNYTEFHFKREEQLIADAGYADLERHRRVHAGFCRRIEEIRWEYFQGIRDQARDEIFRFLTTWLNRHILEEDMRYKSCFIRETAAALAAAPG